MTDSAYYEGRLLLALPAIGDPRFAHAVILLISHDGDGAMGIDIGHPSAMAAGELLLQLGIAHAEAVEDMVLTGGPVEPERGFVIHSGEWSGPHTLAVANGTDVAVSASVDILRAIADGTGPAHWSLALGYAGWGAGQLEGEIAADAWHVTSAPLAEWFAIPPADRWAWLLARDGIDPGRIVMRGGHA